MRLSTTFSFGVILLMPFLTLAQTGPGGVGSSSSNVLWLRPDAGLTLNGTKVMSWSDGSGNGNHAAQSTNAARPVRENAQVNGYPALLFDGSDDELIVPDANSLDLTSWHQFIVVRPKVQKDYNAWLVKGDDGTENYEMLSYSDGNLHMPVYWTNNTRTPPSSPGGQVNTSTFEIIEYSYSASTGRTAYRNGAQIYTDSENKTPKINNRPLVIGNEASTSGRFVDGHIAEVILYNTVLNSAQRIILLNHLAAKYGRTLASNDLYTGDDAASGNYDHEVAGIGRVNASNIQSDSKGSGRVRISSSNLTNNNRFLFWGHNGGADGPSGILDLPLGVLGRWAREWRVSEVNTFGVAADVGNVNIAFDLSGLGLVTASHLRLLVDSDDDGVFADESPISGASLVGGLFQFSNVANLVNGRKFTLGSINLLLTPLPIELLGFDVRPEGADQARLHWATASEQNNAYFTLQRSTDLQNWRTLAILEGAGNSHSRIDYDVLDPAPEQGTAYYRLGQTDHDGTTTWSDQVPFTLAYRYTLWPNP
ncbi:MAG TPA: LamG-like jellyroll fold domain-containing protein, partial [Flavobacteriales bacterium]